MICMIFFLEFSDLCFRIGENFQKSVKSSGYVHVLDFGVGDGGRDNGGGGKNDSGGHKKTEQQFQQECFGRSYISKEGRDEDNGGGGGSTGGVVQEGDVERMVEVGVCRWRLQLKG